MTDKQIIIDDQKKTIYRLQQECTEKTTAIIALGKQLKAKEQECEELKEAIDGLLKIQYQLADSCKKYVQTLTEIKEIAETISQPMGTEKSCNRVILAKQILQKIRECEVEMNREQKERIMEKIEYDIKSDMIAQEEKKKIKRSECPYGGIDCAWCDEDCV